MLHDLGVNRGQERRVVANVVLDHDDRLHAHHVDIVRHVHAIFDVLDDREEDVDVALKRTSRSMWSQVLVLDEVVQLAMVVGKNDDRNVEAGLVHPARQLAGVHITDLRGADDEVVAAEILDQAAAPQRRSIPASDRERCTDRDRESRRARAR